MEQSDPQSYKEIIKDIFSNLMTPERVPLETFRQVVVVSILMCVILCLPASAIFALLVLFFPLEDDSGFLLAIVPWVIIGPFIPLVVYFGHYRRPRRNRKLMEELLSTVSPDAPVTIREKFIYSFHKNKFLFEIYRDVYMRDNAKKNDVDVVRMYMTYDSGIDDFAGHMSVVEDIMSYCRDKSVGRYIRIGYYTLFVDMETKNISHTDIDKIVAEFLYIAGRFRLVPVSVERSIEKTNELLAWQETLRV